MVHIRESEPPTSETEIRKILLAELPRYKLQTYLYETIAILLEIEDFERKFLGKCSWTYQAKFCTCFDKEKSHIQLPEIVKLKN